MATLEAVKRTAKLAIQRFGVRHDIAAALMRQAMFSQALGEPADFIELLVSGKHLAPEQADALRQEADKTVPAHAKRAPWAGAQPLPDALDGYRLIRKLGTGGMGEVHLAEDPATNRQFAMKILSPAIAKIPGVVERFLNEAEHVAKLDHPNIVKGFGGGYDHVANRHYLLMEYVAGHSAYHLLLSRGVLPVSDGLRIAFEVARALEHAHARGIIHRDIKPDNILISPEGYVKLADLGLAKDLVPAEPGLTKSTQGFGTPYYMPFEQAISAKAADARSDLFALGATLYHLITGVVPFPGNSALEVTEKKQIGTFAPPSEIVPEMPPVVDHLLFRLLAKWPKDRFQTASEVLVAIERSGLMGKSMGGLPTTSASTTATSAAASANQRTLIDPQSISASSKKRREWFVRFRDRQGMPHAELLSTAQILKDIRSGRYAELPQASRTAQGPYRPLAEFAEFRSVAEAPPPALPAEPSDGDPLWLKVAAAVAAGLGLGFLAWRLFGW